MPHQRLREARPHAPAGLEHDQERALVVQPRLAGRRGGRRVQQLEAVEHDLAEHHRLLRPRRARRRVQHVREVVAVALLRGADVQAVRLRHDRARGRAAVARAARPRDRAVAQDRACGPRAGQLSRRQV